MKHLWTLRPTALGWMNYAEQSRQTLLHSYDLDHVAAAGVTIPAKPQGTLRMAQWNVQGTQSDVIITQVCRHDPDVVLFHEWGASPPGDAPTHVLQAMRHRGYRTHHVAQTSYPTAVWTRMGKSLDDGDDDDEKGRAVLSVDDVRLDEERGAVVLRVRLPCAHKGASQHVWIYGTHLTHAEYWTGHRSAEMSTLLQHVAEHVRPEDGLVVAGDFNQQRADDYLPAEWERICASKERRQEEVATQGVDELLAAEGLRCVWDHATADRNWPAGQPPPATHWSGTVIDYAYSRNLCHVGTYVSPCGLSDHRLIITDWKVGDGA
jgi:exonuclease III